jgi:outer membrane lipoprotein carrier protein
VRLRFSTVALVFCLPWLCAGTGLAADRSLDDVCRAVEHRYNSAKSLSAHFDQRYIALGRLPRSESGELVLRKPARMRWDYSSPPGKTFVSDGKWIWFYNPQARKVERSPLKESDDLRAPLAFLLGKLEFRREFGAMTLRQGPDGTVIDAAAKNEKVPYESVQFTIGPDDSIRRVVVVGRDHSRMDFVFAAEKLNAPVAEAIFHFVAPPGVPVVDAASPGEMEGAEQH